MKSSISPSPGLLRTFQFLGFAPVEADDPRAPASWQFVSLVYEIDTDDEDSLGDEDEPLIH